MNKRIVILGVVVAAGAALLAEPVSAGVQKCKAVVNPATGSIEVSASNVSGAAIWGVSSTAAPFGFFNTATCSANGKLKKCLLGDPDTEAANTPPPGCRVFVKDASADPPCVAYIKQRCTVLNAVPGVDSAFALLHPKLVFITQGTLPGNFGGLSVADALCNSEASAAGLSGTFKAWVSTSSSSVASRFTHGGPYELVGGGRVADDWAALTDGSIDHAIDRDATGASRNASVWTGTQADGTSGAENCSNWTSSSNVILDTSVIRAKPTQAGPWLPGTPARCPPIPSIASSSDLVTRTWRRIAPWQSAVRTASLSVVASSSS
jgi:hypothetical protein